MLIAMDLTSANKRKSKTERKKKHHDDEKEKEVLHYKRTIRRK